MKKTKYFPYFIVLLFLVFQSCEKEESETLSVNTQQVAIGKDGGAQEITITSSSGNWKINNQISDWLEVTPTSGKEKVAKVTFKVASRTLENRSGKIIITAGNAQPVEVLVSQVSSDYLFSINGNPSTISFKNSGESKDLIIITDAPAWSISNSNSEWIQYDKTTGGSGSTTIKITVKENKSGVLRSTKINITADNASPFQVELTQSGSMYPSYNTSPLAPDPTGMSSSAIQLASKINLGWNIGNTMEAIGGETAWGNPRVSKELIQLVKQNGFNAIRIPCSWNQYLENSSTAQIKTEWLNRVKEVVQYCVDNDMYVLLNIHWDGGWLENNVTPEKQEANNAKQRALWEQITTHLREFDEHLLLASANEPNVENATQMTVLQSYHQTFVDAVRSTGGKNSYRVLVVQGPSTDIEKTNSLMTSLPKDEIQNKLMVEIHYYTPYQFCLMDKDADWGKMFYYWGKDYHSQTDAQRNSSWGEESTVDQMMGLMKSKFVSMGVPVILGEYAVARRLSLTGSSLDLHLASRAYYLKYITKKAKDNGILPFYWDAGGTGDLGSGLFNRSTNTVGDQQALNALIEGAKTL